MTFSVATLPHPQQNSLSHQVQETLEAMLCGGILKPDDRTSIRELADLLGVSTMPVRDAVARLTAQGALAIRRNRAVVVPRLSSAEFEDLTEARILIESEAARKSTRLMTPAILQELTTINDAFITAMAEPDGQEAIRLNQRFHFCLYAAAASPTLTRIIGSNWLRAGPMINLDLGLPGRRQRNANSISSHLSLLEGLAESDATRVVTALVQDIRGASEFIIDNALKPAEKEKR